MFDLFKEAAGVSGDKAVTNAGQRDVMEILTDCVCRSVHLKGYDMTRSVDVGGTYRKCFPYGWEFARQ